MLRRRCWLAGVLALACARPPAQPVHAPNEPTPAPTRDPAGPRVGDIAPDFELPDARGNPVALATARRDGPVLLIFYRGHW